jgi:hypothetical protein
MFIIHTLNHINLHHTLLFSTYSKIHFNIILPSTHRYCKFSVSFRYLTKSVCVLSSSVILVIYLSHAILLDLTIVVTSHEMLKLCTFHHYPPSCSSLYPQIFHSVLFPKSFSLSCYARPRVIKNSSSSYSRTPGDETRPRCVPLVTAYSDHVLCHRCISKTIREMDRMAAETRVFSGCRECQLRLRPTSILTKSWKFMQLFKKGRSHCSVV